MLAPIPLLTSPLKGEELSISNHHRNSLSFKERAGVRMGSTTHESRVTNHVFC